MESRRTNWADLTAEPLTESGQAAYDDEARLATPVDDAKVDESIITQDDWDRAEGAHERFKSLLGRQKAFPCQWLGFQQWCFLLRCLRKPQIWKGMER